MSRTTATVCFGIGTFLGLAWLVGSCDAEAEAPTVDRTATRAPLRTTGPAAPPSPAHDRNAIGEGEWMVDEDMSPGTYVSTGAVKDAFALCSATVKGAEGEVIEWKTANAGERVVIEVPTNAARFVNHGCEPFVKR